MLEQRETPVFTNRDFSSVQRKTPDHGLIVDIRLDLCDSRV